MRYPLMGYPSLTIDQVGTVVMTIVAIDLAYLPIKDGDFPKLC